MLLNLSASDFFWDDLSYLSISFVWFVLKIVLMYFINTIDLKFSNISFLFFARSIKISLTTGYWFTISTNYDAERLSIKVGFPLYGLKK